MRVDFGGRLSGRLKAGRDFKMGKVYLMAMGVVMLAVLITVAAVEMEASRV